MKHIQQVAHTHLLQISVSKNVPLMELLALDIYFFKFLMNVLWSIVTLSSICRASSDYTCSRCLSLVKADPLKICARRARQLKILPCLRINRRLRFGDFFWLTRKRWGEQQEFSRWKKELYKVFKKEYGWRKLVFFFSKPLHLFLWKLWINVRAARCLAFPIWQIILWRNLTGWDECVI